MNDTTIPKPAPPVAPVKSDTPPAAPAGAPTSVLQQTPIVSVPQPTAPTTPPPSPVIGSATVPRISTTPPAPAPASTTGMKPPTSLSALSSMSSNSLPPQPPKTVPPSNPGTPAPEGKGPVYAAPKKSPLKFLPLIIGALLLIAVGIFAAMKFLGNRNASVSPTDNTNTQDGGRQVVTGEQITLEYWGLWEPNEVLDEVLKEFEQQNVGVTVRYTKQSHRDYRERLQTAIASGNGPDVFRYHASWVPMLTQELAKMPASVMSTADFKKTFYPVASKQLEVDGQMVGIPLMYDGLALYYNKEIFRTANATPPKTWPELKTLASQLTVRSDAGIERGGLAIGNATNVEHFADILALLIIQNGGDIKNPNTPQGRDALLFYTNFVRQDKVWSESLPSSTVAFARGDVAMMFAPSWRAHEIKAANPQLEFGIAPLPILDKKVTWASYWAEGVNAKSKKAEMSWKLLKYMSTPETLRKLYSNASEVRAFGEIYPRVDMAKDLENNEFVAPYLSDAPQAEAGFMSGYTHDNGLNDVTIKYYEDAVNALLTGKKVEDTLVTVDQGTKQIMRQYNIKSTTTN